MQPKILTEEKQHLNLVVELIKQKQKENKIKAEDAKYRFEELMQYYADEHSFIDDEEKASVIQSLTEINNQQSIISLYGERLIKQLNSPYFARLDFCDDLGENKYYIGIHSLTQSGEQMPVVCDWRAPISSLYYDYGVGKAQYEAPAGIFEGEIKLKRQIKIENNKIKYFFDTKQVIADDVLQQVLSQNTSEKMSNIVATIQSEQNKIIREKINKSILVQGVAGSGKTSVALHRIAYLLYQNRQTLRAEDVLILSPNRIFSSYISNVLPELGEENIGQITFEELFKDELYDYCGDMETRSAMIENILNNNSILNKNRQREITIKNNFNFYNLFKNYINNYFNLEFNATDIKIGEKTIKKEIINELFKNKYKNKIPAIRISWIADYIIDFANLPSNNESIYSKIKQLLYPMFSSIKLEDIYSSFLATQNMQFEKINNIIKYEDIAPLLFIKNYLLGIKQMPEIKYLVIDEMQDYSPILFDIINDMFSCNKIVLGDVNQCVEKQLENDYVNNLADLLDAKLFEINTCYRSTKQIGEFASLLMPNILLKTFDRNGDKPEILNIKNEYEKIAYIEKLVHDNDNYKKIAIITKTQKHAEEVYKQLEDNQNVCLYQSGIQEPTKVCVVSVALAKGLEFDCVILCDFSSSKNKLTNQLKYIASTRALHKLYCIN